MFGTRSEVVSILRSMALGGSKPSEMLRTIISQHPGEALDRNFFYQYFTEAFCFSEGEASPLFGWLPDGKGELQDSNIDYFMSKRIQKTRDVREHCH